MGNEKKDKRGAFHTLIRRSRHAIHLCIGSFWEKHSSFIGDTVRSYVHPCFPYTYYVLYYLHSYERVCLGPPSKETFSIWALELSSFGIHSVHKYYKWSYCSITYLSNIMTASDPYISNMVLQFGYISKVWVHGYIFFLYKSDLWEIGHTRFSA